jgi:hypothetical protein
MKPLGLHVHRLKDNEEEKRFADAWATWNRDGLSTLAALLDPRPWPKPAYLGHEPSPATNRDHVVAATVVQWLGSPVGQSFLEELGYTRTRDNKPA